MHKFNHENHAKLDSPERKNILPPEKILLDTGLKNGDTMLDIGAGTGYFSFPAAEMVGINGLVYAADSSTEMIRIIEERVQERTLSNVQTVLTTEYDFNIMPGCIDYALASLVLHEVADKNLFIKEIYKSLNETGVAIIIEWIYQNTDKGPSISERIDPYDVMALFGLNGFNEISLNTFNEYFYIISAVKN